MALQFRRGTAAERTSWGGTPAAGEPLYTTDDNRLYVGDAVTPGGTYVLDVPISRLNNVTTIDTVTRTISGYSVTSNVATIYLTAAHSYYIGLSITITGSAVTALNSTFTITGIPSSTSFTVALTTADVAITTTNGTVTPNLASQDILTYITITNEFITLPNRLDLLADTAITNVVTTDYIGHNGSFFVNKKLNPFAQFAYDVGTAPASTIASSEKLGRNQGTMSAINFANKATNGGRGPSAAGFDSLLSGITFSSGTGNFTGMTTGDYLIEFTLNFYVDNPTPTNATPPRLLMTPTATDASANYLYSQTSQIGLLPYASYGSAQAVITQSGYLMATFEDSNAANNQFFIELDQDVSNTYFVNDAIVSFTQLTSR